MPLSDYSLKRFLCLSKLQPIATLEALHQVRHAPEGGHSINHIVVQRDSEVQDIAIHHFPATQYRFAVERPDAN